MLFSPTEPLQPHCVRLKGSAYDLAATLCLRAYCSADLARETRRAFVQLKDQRAFLLGEHGEICTFSSTLTQQPQPPYWEKEQQETARELLGSRYPALLDCGVKARTLSCVELKENSRTKNVSFGGLQTCQLTKVCPACSKKESFLEAIAVRAAQRACLGRGGTVLLLTLTIPHEVGEALSDLLTLLNSVYKSLRKCKAFQIQRKQGLFIGDIKKLEATYSAQNGWHPHYHLLLFLNHRLSPSAVEDLRVQLANTWSKAFSKAKRFAHVSEHAFDRGVHISDEAGADGYLDTYLTKSPLNESNVDLSSFEQSGDGQAYTPGDLMRLASKGNKRAAELVQEYGAAVRKLHQLRWSNGLERSLGIDRKNLRERSRDARPSHEVFAKIDNPTWNRMAQRGLVTQMRKVAAFGRQAVLAFLDRHQIDYRLVGAGHCEAGNITLGRAQHCDPWNGSPFSPD